MKSFSSDPVRLWARALRWAKASKPLRAVLLPCRDALRYLRSWLDIIRGGWIHAYRGETPKEAHFALVNLFAANGGRANDVISRVVALAHPPYHLRETSGVLGNLKEDDLRRIQEQLERDGYYVFHDCLSAEFCERVIKQSLALDCQLVGDEVYARGEPIYGRYTRGAPITSAYLVGRDDTTDIPEVQELISDPSIVTVAQNYLRSKPIFTAVALSWSAAVKDKPDSQAAQEFHWDMERIRWLRYFIYLTDVGPENGPHCFIRGTHRTGGIPSKLRRLGYVRHSDETILQAYDKDAYREFHGPRGTIIAEDSRGFHKGKLVSKGDRLLLAFELSNTTFGANKRHAIRNIHVPRFGEMARQYPRLYANFDFVPGLVR